MIKGIIFDLDNTLVDFMRMKKHSCEEAMVAMIDSGLEMDKEKGLKILYKLYDKYGIEHKQIFQEFLKKVNKKIDYKILANGIVAYRRVKAGFLIPYPHVHSTLLALKNKGIKLAILTDAPRMRAWTRLASLKLTDFFDAVITFEETGKKKPHKKPFEKALKSLGLDANEVLMVGDWPERDIEGAKNLGIKTCFAKYGYGWRKKKLGKVRSNFMINDIKELLRIIK